MAEKLCKEQQISFGNSTKYSDFIDGKYILLNYRLKGPYCSKKIASSKKKLVIFFTEISAIGFYCPRRDFAQKAKSRGGTLVTRASIKESTYS